MVPTSCASTARRARCSATTATGPRCGALPRRRAATRAAFVERLIVPAGRRRLVGRPARRCGVPGALPGRVLRQPRDARLRATARTGGRSPAARARYVEALTAPFARPHPRSRTPVAADRAPRRRTSTVDAARRRARALRRGRDRRRTPTRRWRMLADPSDRRARGPRRDPLPAQRGGPAHRPRAAAAPPRAPGRAGTTTCSTSRPAADDRHLPHEPPAVARRRPRVLRDAQPHATRSTRSRSSATIPYAHPVFTPDGDRRAGAATTRSAACSRTHYCGAYWGWGFHEDGVVSARARSRERCASGRRERERALRGLGPPPPLRSRVEHEFRYRVVHGLPRPRRAARAARRGRALVGAPARRSCASAARDYLGDPASPLADARPRARRGAHRRAARRARSGCSPTCATLGPLLQPGQLLLLLRPRRRAASRRSSPRSRTRPGASATPTCSARAAATARVLDGGVDKALPRLAVHGHGPALRAGASPSPGATLLGAHRSQPRGRRGALRRDARACDRARARRRARWPACCAATRRDAARRWR